MSSHASRVDIDNWEALGNPGWNFDTLQPYYRKSETYNPPIGDELGTSIMKPELHGATGPVQTSFPRDVGEFDRAWAKAWANLGLDPKSDPRDGQTLGGYSLPKYMDTMARRSHAGSAFYKPNEGRSNLTVLTGALVTSIMLEREGGEIVASGVKYEADGKEYSIKTKGGGEVILSAGTVQSPQILELSGIGSETLLSPLGIEVMVDNPNVGENLQVISPSSRGSPIRTNLITQDHNMVGFAYQARDNIPTGEMLSQPGVLDWALNEWTAKGSGPLAGGATGTAFLSYTQVLPSTTRTEFHSRIHSLLASAPPSTHPGVAQQHALQVSQLLNEHEADLQFNFGAMGVNPAGQSDPAKIFNHGQEGAYAGIMSALTHPFSRGSVHISSSDPKVYPVINPQYLAHPIDSALLTQGLLFTQTIAATPPLADLYVDDEGGDGAGKKPQPGFGVEGRMGEGDAERIVREGSGSSWHPVGTCAMLPREKGGVVDARMRVYGVKGLRVVDASVFPLHVRGNIVSAVYAVAERVADLIKEDRRSDQVEVSQVEN
jgi:choline dehydrogenase